MYQYESETPNPFSMFFSSVPNHHHPYDESEMYSFASSSSVDCTLSLGTPSTRMTNTTADSDYDRRSSGSCTSNFCWDNLLLQQQYYSQHGTTTNDLSPPSPAVAPAQKGSSRGGCISNSGRESLLARRCANCDTTSTPLWRNGPRGPKSLCNACGIRYKKEERRATASVSGAGASNLWAQQQHSQEMPYYSPATEFAFDDGGFSWRLDVSERPNYVHDFTRYT